MGGSFNLRLALFLYIFMVNKVADFTNFDYF